MRAATPHTVARLEKRLTGGDVDGNIHFGELGDDQLLPGFDCGIG
jgi:hypothetical protein